MGSLGRECPPSRAALVAGQGRGGPPRRLYPRTEARMWCSAAWGSVTRCGVAASSRMISSRSARVWISRRAPMRRAGGVLAGNGMTTGSVTQRRRILLSCYWLCFENIALKQTRRWKERGNIVAGPGARHKSAMILAVTRPLEHQSGHRDTEYYLRHADGDAQQRHDPC